MQWAIPRSALVVCSVAAVTAFAAEPGQAAVQPFTAAPIAVTADSVTLVGSIVTGGAATPWEFSYGTGPFVSTYTATRIIPAGGQPSVPVLADVRGLTPATTYTFQLLANAGTLGSTTTPLTYVSGGVLMFKTKGAGSASLLGRRLKVHRGRAAVAMTCSSTLTCRGMLSITARHRGKRVTCASAPFTVEPGESKQFTTNVFRRCRALLTAAPPKGINAHLEAGFSSFQKSISTGVKLTLAP